MKEKNIIIKRIIYLTLIILTSLIIFGFSTQNGEESTSVSRKIAIEIVNIFNKDVQNKESIILQSERVIRKLAHFSIYTTLGIWLMAFINTFEIKERKMIMLAIFLGFFYACSDELHQRFVSGRSASFIDIMIDTIGVMFGICIVLGIKEICKILQKRYEKIKKK